MHNLLRRLCAALLPVTLLPAFSPAQIYAEEEPPQLSAAIEYGYPGAVRSLSLQLTDNPGLAALGAVITLPEILTPLTDADGLPVFTATDALSGGYLDTGWNPDTHQISLVYASNSCGAANPLLGSFRVTVSESAELFQPADITLHADRIAAKDGILPADIRNTTVFMTSLPEPRTLSAEEVTLEYADEPVKLSLSPEPEAGSCTWKSSAPDIAEIDENGVLTAKSNGTCTVTLLCETLTYTCDVTVQLAQQFRTRTFRADRPDGTVQAALLYPADSPVTWESDAPETASVSADGLVTVHRRGKFTLTASRGEERISAVCTADYPIAMNNTEYAAWETGDTVLLSVLYADEPVTWASADPLIAAVDASGKVTFLSEGETVITASSGSESCTCRVVNQPFLRGDTTLNGSIEIDDAFGALRSYVATALTKLPSPLSALAQRAADVDRSGTVDRRDAYAILTYQVQTMIHLTPDWDTILQTSERNADT